MVLALTGSPLLADHAEETGGLFPDSGPDNHFGEKVTAVALSLGGTVLPLLAASAISDRSDNDENQGLVISLVLGGILLGPSAGQFYAHSPGLGLVGAGVRGLGGYIALAGAAQAMAGFGCGMSFGGEPEECDEGGDGGGTILLGLLIYTGGSLFSLAAIPSAVDRQHQRMQSAAFEWAPTLDLSRSGDVRPGAKASLRF